MRYLQLWQTELPPEIDVSRGPINGAAQSRVYGSEVRESSADAKALGYRGAVSADKGGNDAVTRANSEAPGSRLQEESSSGSAAAPPEPTPADSEGVDPRATDSQEGPGTEREGGAWVPWAGGECPVPNGTLVDVIAWGKAFVSMGAACGNGWKDGTITAYRLSNPTPRGPCRLPPDHPHAELERLWRSDDTLRCWRLLSDSGWKEVIAEKPAWFLGRTYHVGHVPPQEAA